MIYINGENYTIDQLREGYEIITGIAPNDEIYGQPLTDEQIIEYMTEALKE
jgi:hypothetical protein